MLMEEEFLINNMYDSLNDTPIPLAHPSIQLFAKMGINDYIFITDEEFQQTLKKDLIQQAL